MQICLRVGLATLLAAGAAAADTSRACAVLAERHNNSLQPRRWVSYLGVPRPLAVWSIRSDPAQSALAHLLKLMLQHLLGYEDVVMRQLNTTRDALERLKNVFNKVIPEEFVAVPGVHVRSLSTEETIAKDIENNKTAFVRAFSRHPLRLQVNLTKSAFANSACNISKTDWLHFANFTPGECSFLLHEEVKNSSDQWEKSPDWCAKSNACAALLVPHGHSSQIILLRQFISTHRLKLVPVLSPNDQNLHNNRSLLTLSDAETSLHSHLTYMFMHKHLLIYAKRVALVVYHFNTLATYTDIASKLSRSNDSSKSVEDEACDYILEKEAEISNWLPPEVSTVFIQYYLCHNNPYLERIGKAMDIIQEELQRRVSFTPRLLNAKLVCNATTDSTLITEIKTFEQNGSWPSFGAMVAPRANAATQIMARDEETLLMLYESQERPCQDCPVFLSSADWGSVTAAAVAWLVMKGFDVVALKITNRSLEEVESLQMQLFTKDISLNSHIGSTKAKILVVHADRDTIERLACEVTGHPSITGLLLLQEWSVRPLSCETINERTKRPPATLWSVSRSWQGGNLDTKRLTDIGDWELRQRLQHELGDTWPPQVAPMADAIIMAAHALDDLRQQHPMFMYDLHGINVTSRYLSEILRKSKTNGVTQWLKYTKNNTLAEPVVFVTQWEDGVSARLDAVMRILTPTSETDILWSRNENQHYEIYIVIPFISCILLFFLCLLGFKCWKERYLKLIESYPWPVPAQLAVFEVRRDELELHEKLGEGSSGRVFLALWRGKHKLHVAVKTPVLGPLGAPALLQEARIMGSLQHPNVVRLLGIVSNGTPPLVVLEYAIRGDLRRYLAATERAAGGSSHVSPVLLTRLAREAAAALAYLASRNIVHRDVRAANCLIDEHHTLKLADFGMARELPREATEGVGINQYLCRRRALFPVLWMAPESLRRGVFSTATDMWSYGLLLIELVTMGARPFGNLPPSMVCCYVINGGIPLLPPGATFDMYNLARRCWARAADSRITAEQAQAFLERRRSALKPCAPGSLTPAFTLRSTSSLNEISFNSEINKDLMVCRACSI